MSKKLIASLLALGLVLSPVTGAINETYATEAPADQKLKDETKEDVVSNKIEVIKGFSEKYKNIKNNPDYRLSDTSTRDAFEKAMRDAASYVENEEPASEELDKHISEVKSTKSNLFTNAKENLDKLKDSIIKSDKIIANNTDSSENEDYKNLEEKIKEAKDILKNIDKAEVDGESLVKLRKELDELSKKAIEEFNDTNDYKEPTDEERDNLGNEAKGEQASPEEKNIIEVLKKLREYIKTKDAIVEGLKNEELKNKYLENVDLAQNYSNYYALGNKESLDTYKELEAYLAKLKAEIEKEKTQTPDPIKAKNKFEDKDASLDDLTKAYNNFNKSITDLSTFLRNRIEKLVDEDKDFRESENFKKADENVLKYYDELIKKAKEDIAKTEADANDLNKLYRDINIAKEAIKENLSDQARRLKAAISESQSFMNSSQYKNFGTGLEGSQKEAKKRYEELVNKAKELDKAGKLDSDEAKTTLELIENTKAFIEGEISEKKYLSNEYYHILKELKKQKGYEGKINQAARDRIDEALKMYEKGEKNEDTILSALDAALKEDSVKGFIDEINKSKDPNKARDELLAKLRTLAEEEESFKAGEKYEKAPKELKADYDKTLEEAKKIIEKENPTETEIKDAYEKLKDAVNKIEIRHIIDRRLVVLADKYKQNQLKIKNPAERKAIADKINALAKNPYTTMEEVEKVEAELDKLIKTQQAVTTTTVAPQSQVPTTTRPVSTVTNPGSIVKTGINGIAKVAAVLAVAAIILKLTSKKGEKDETNK